MSELEQILEDSLSRLAQGESIDEVLAAYPKFEKELRPLLKTSSAVKQFEQVAPSAEFKRRTRTALQGHMHAHPRSATVARPKFAFKFAVGFAAVLLAFTSVGTALAQSALPGQVLYGWKLASEQVWRAVHINPTYVDLELSSRRLEELLAVQNNPAHLENAIEAYAAALATLKADVDLIPSKALSARDLINSQKETVRSLLDTAGRNVDEFFIIIPTLDEVISKNPDQEIPGATPQLQLPQVTPEKMSKAEGELTRPMTLRAWATP